MSGMRPYNDPDLLAYCAAPDAIKFPTLAHAFLCNEPTGSKTVTDSIGGVVLIRTGQTAYVQNNGDGTVTLSNTFEALNPNSPVWITPGTKSLALMIFGKPTSAGSTVNIGGVAAGAGFAGISSGNAVITTGTPFVSDGVTDVTGAAYGTSADGSSWYSRLVTYQPNNATGLNSSNILSNNARQDQAATSTVGITTMGAINPDVNLNAGTNPALILLFAMPTMPNIAELRTGFEWIHRNLVNTAGKTKAVYPGFLGRAFA